MIPGQGVAPYLDQFSRLTAAPPDTAWLSYGQGPQARFHDAFTPPGGGAAAAPSAPTALSGAGVGGLPQPGVLKGPHDERQGTGVTRDDVINDQLGRGYAPPTLDNIMAAGKIALGITNPIGTAAKVGIAGALGTDGPLDGITGNTNQLTPSARAALRAALEAAVPQTGPLSRQLAAAHAFDPGPALRDFERATGMAANTGGLSGALKRDAQYGPGTERGGNDGGRRDGAQGRDARGGSGGRHGRGDTRGGRSGFL